MAITDWSTWQPKERAVLTLVREGTQLLLIHKKRGLGTGKVSFPGGRVEPGESWIEAAHRELAEETGLSVRNMVLHAELKFQFTSGYGMEVRAFVATGGTGTLTPCDEAEPFWWPQDQVPWSQMWADDHLWVPPVLAGRGVRGQFTFDSEAMDEARVTVVDRPLEPFNG